MDFYYKKLKEDLNQQRYEHCIRVMKTSQDLAIRYGVDFEKAKLAGLLHDCGKYDSMDRILQEVDEFDIILSKDSRENKHLIHADLGAYLAEKKYGIEDQDILNAIKYHTTGRANMSKLEKIVYLSDIIEPKRNFSGLEELREKTLEDLDLALLYALNSSIINLVNKNKKIHPNTIHARNSLI